MPQLYANGKLLNGLVCDRVQASFDNLTVFAIDLSAARELDSSSARTREILRSAGELAAADIRDKLLDALVLEAVGDAIGHPPPAVVADIDRVRGRLTMIGCAECMAGHGGSMPCRNPRASTDGRTGMDERPDHERGNARNLAQGLSRCLEPIWQLLEVVLERCDTVYSGTVAHSGATDLRVRILRTPENWIETHVTAETESERILKLRFPRRIGSADYFGLPYLLFHEIYIHAFQRHGVAPDKFSLPSTCKFTEGVMDYIAFKEAEAAIRDFKGDLGRHRGKFWTSSDRVYANRDAREFEKVDSGAPASENPRELGRSVLHEIDQLWHRLDWPEWPTFDLFSTLTIINFHDYDEFDRETVVGALEVIRDKLNACIDPGPLDDPQSAKIQVLSILMALRAGARLPGSTAIAVLADAVAPDRDLADSFVNY